MSADPAITEMQRVTDLMARRRGAEWAEIHLLWHEAVLRTSILLAKTCTTAPGRRTAVQNWRVVLNKIAARWPSHPELDRWRQELDAALVAEFGEEEVAP